MNEETKFRLELEDIGIDWETSDRVVQKAYEVLLDNLDNTVAEQKQAIREAEVELGRVQDLVEVLRDGLIKNVKKIGEELEDDDLVDLAEDYGEDVDDLLSRVDFVLEVLE